MKSKSGSLNLDRSVLKKASLGRIKWSVVVTGLALFLLAAATAALVVAVVKPGSSSGVAAGIEASSARWSALGSHYAPDYAAIADVSSARWKALGVHYAPDYEASAAASSARYEAMAGNYGREDADRERGEQASTARWVALGSHYAPDHAAIADAATARWKAVGEHFAPDYEASAAASTARWVALGAHYAEAASERKFVDTVRAFEEAFQAGDVDQLIEFYASDAVSLPPGFPASVGREAIEADLRWFFGEFELERDFALVDYEVAGTYATRLGRWTQTLTPRSGGDPITEIGRCIVGFKKVRGEWLIVWEIWNTYEPPSP